MLTSIGVIAAACGIGQLGASPAPGGGGTAAKGGEFHGAWPFELPPAGNFNGYAPKAILLTGGIYFDLHQPTLGMYKWADGTWINFLSETTALKGENYEVKLRKGLKWSDGKAFTAKDVETTFLLGRLTGFPIWQNIDRIEIVDDNTVNFHINRPSGTAERHIMKQPIRPDATFGALAAEAKALFAGGKDQNSDEGKALRTKLLELRPTEPLSVGPYKLDVASMNEAQVTFVRNPGGLFADVVNFDKIVLFNGETAAVTPLVLAGDIDYATHGFPVATDKQFQEQGFRIIRAPLATGPGLFFHWEKAAAFTDVRIRQAVAYAIDRKENATIAFGESASPIENMHGFADGITDVWIPAGDKAKLNKYEFNPGKAEELIKAAGYTKGTDGVYAKGSDRLEFELTVPSDYADWFPAAPHVADSLNKVGFKITVRGVVSSQHLVDVNEGNFQIAFRGWGAGPHPQLAYIQNFRVHNTTATGGKGGMKLPLKQKLANGQDVDFDDLINKIGDGFSAEGQKPFVTQMALAFNELLPIVQLWERKGNNPVNTKDRVTGWKPEGDPIYKNSHGADNFTIAQILDGTLRKIN